MLSENNAKQMNAQLWQLETGIYEPRPTSDFAVEDILARVVDLMYREKGLDSYEAAPLDEGYEYDTKEVKKPKFDLSFCKGRK